jgi:hypothetical protein
MIVRETGTDMSLFDDMTVFVRAVEAESFSGAAQQLGVAKSVVSRRMASLEATPITSGRGASWPMSRRRKT